MRKRSKKDYWTKEQEQAICDYLVLTKDDPENAEADYIFSTKIYEPLKKLVENIMYTYHLGIPEIPTQDQVHDTIGFVATKMKKFDPEKGHKSFSYYGTVAKNYMIMQKNKYYNKKIQSVDIEDVIGLEFEQNIFIDAEPESEFRSKEFLFQVLAEDLECAINNDLTLDNNVYKVSEAIVFLLKNYQKVNVHNKRQFYFIVREFTGLNAKDITKSMAKVKDIYEKSRRSLQ